MEPGNVVVDTNILFSSLVPRLSRVREAILVDAGHTFFSPRFVVVELFKHKERIVAETDLGEEELLECLQTLLARITFIDEGAIPIGTWVEGYRLCGDIDPKDAPIVTLALHVDGLVWTVDEELKIGLRKKGFDRFYGEP